MHSTMIILNIFTFFAYQDALFTIIHKKLSLQHKYFNLPKVPRVPMLGAKYVRPVHLRVLFVLFLQRSQEMNFFVIDQILKDTTIFFIYVTKCGQQHKFVTGRSC